jgi:ABC-2 type transport system ATP-binding protein
LKGGKCRNAVEGVKEFTHVGGIQDKLIRSLSKGMKQRVSLGRALIHDPPVLVMDEPAAGLDPRARVEFRELVSILAEQGRAILISSHILTELTEICNGVVIIEKGKILETGTISSVLSRCVPRQTIALRTLNRREDLCRDLLEMPCISDVRQAGDEIHIEFEGTDNQSAEILSILIARGFKVTDYHHVRVDLEDIFMKLTKGDVQ